MTDDPKEKPKTNGQDEDDDRKEKPWPDDNVPRPPYMPPPEPPQPDARDGLPR